jgi:diguanylate cyclase (GGDEF)-like protein
VNNLLEIYESVKKFKVQVQLDPLTVAYNKFFLETMLENIFNLHEVKSVAVLEIDDFDEIIEDYSQQMAEEVVRHFIRTIRYTIRKTDYIIRFEENKFLIFMPNTTKVEAFFVMQKIRKSLKPYNEIVYTFSGGIADEGETLAEMVRIAMERLEEAIEDGRDVVIVN